MRRSIPLLGVIVAAGCSSPPPAEHSRPTRIPFAIDFHAIPPEAESHDDADLSHLRYLLTEDEILQWGALAPADRAAWFRSVWGRVDASPTTPENERKDEHYRRLAYVRAHFPIDEEPGWDRRGELLLRYGSPQARIVTPADVQPHLGFVAPQELWIYSWLQQAFRLEDHLLQGNYQESWGEVKGTSRWDARFGNQPIDIGSTFSLERGGTRLEGLKAEQELQRMLGRGDDAVEGALPHAFYLDQGGAKLDFVFDVVNFAGEEGKTRVEIHSAFDAGDLEYVETRTAWTATLDQVAVARTLDYEEVARAEHARRDSRTSTDWAGTMVLDETALELPAGRYRLALQARDRNSGDIGIYLAETVVRDLSLPDLALSDIQLAQDVRTSSASGRFRKGEYFVVPYPLGTYPADVPVYLFFEVYHLTLSPRGETFYTVEFTVRSPRADGSEGSVLPGVGTAFDARGRSATAREFVVLDTGVLESALYDVEVRVTDRITELSATASVTFGVDVSGRGS